ncbi:MAG: trimethylamine methyltransferase family protein [Phycisphaerales bacterium]|nr:MAG: trimethylamine methyltransferase family protein [Phycisphaerales bacterium]
MRPTIRFLTDDLIRQIVDEAISILCTLGVQVHNKQVLSMLADHKAKVDTDNFHVNLTEDIIQKAIKTAPHSFKLYDVMGNQTHDFSGHNVHFTPGSTALNILDCQTQQMRKPLTQDFIDFSKIISQLENIASTSTAFIPTDVHEKISDSYRLFLSLLYCEKPVVTGAFTVESFNVMKDLQLAVRNSESQLKKKPLTIFSCCPTSPLKWCEVTSQNLIDCARYSIPVEFIAMPLAGFMAPVTLTGTLIQHTAETLSGVVISQLSNPGTPILYGGSPAIFDHRFETTPMGAVETMMIDCAYNEIGKFLNLPTQAYISMSDAKQLDAQAGLESGAGATLAALAGINSVSGPGMIDFESCQSLEKLVLDNEMCGMTFRLIDGVTPRDDFPALPIFEELIEERHLLVAEHTRRHRRKEIFYPGPAIDRANRQRWKQQGAKDLHARLGDEVNKLLKTYQPSALPETTKKDLLKLMEEEARRYGQDHLPLPPMTT